MAKRYNFTYQTKNLVNGKTYVGVHSTDKLNDHYIGGGTHLQRAVRKYGKHNFSREILCFFDTIDQAYEEEYYIVDEKWCKDPSNYNMRRGGRVDGPYKKGKINYTPELRRKMSLSHRKRTNKKYYYIHDESGKRFDSLYDAYDSIDFEMKLRTFRAQLDGQCPNNTGFTRHRKEGVALSQ